MTQYPAESVASPCIGVCQIEPSTGHCRGCLRTLSEITAWSKANEHEKREIIAAVAARRRQGHPAVDRQGRERARRS